MNKTLYTVDLSMILNRKAAIKIYAVLLLLCICTTHLHAQEVIITGQGNVQKEVLVLPVSYIMDSNFENKGTVKTGKLHKKQSAAFMEQLEKAAAKTAAKGGNVFQVARIEDNNQKGRYKFHGTAWYAPDVKGIKEKIDKKRKKINEEHYAFLTIYRPGYSMGFNDSLKFEIVINDTLTLTMKSNTKYILKVAKEGKINIGVKDNDFTQHVTVDIKTGNNYYLRGYINVPHSGKYINTGELKVRVRGYTPYLEKIEDMQGAIESSMVTQIVVSKKI